MLIYFYMFYLEPVIVGAFRGTIRNYSSFTSRHHLKKRFFDNIRLNFSTFSKIEPKNMTEDVTVFHKIVKGEIPCKKVYEDDLVLAFHDINPEAPTHILVIPKEFDGLARLSDATERHEKILGHMLVTVSKIVKDNNLGDFRLVINNGPKALQSVFYLHMHILAGRSFSWPPG